MPKPVVVVVGSLNCDMAVRVRALPVPNQTVMGREAELSAGGKGLNQAVAAAAAAAHVYLVGAMGDDHFGQIVQGYLRQTTVDDRFVEIASGAATGAAVIVVDDEGNNMISVAPGANTLLSPARAKRVLDQLDVVSVLLAQLETPIPTVAAALTAALGRGATTILNPAPAHRDILPHLPLVDILTPNETELAELTGQDASVIEHDEALLAQAIAGLQARSGGTVVATRGSRGLLAYDGRHFLSMPAFPIDAVDTTGAGDVFNGALAACLARGEPFADAMRFASAAAAISVTRRSAQGSAPSRAEVEALLAAHPAIRVEEATHADG